jgi:hypothetical protein
VARGGKSRLKAVAIDGIGPADVERAFGKPAA